MHSLYWCKVYCYRFCVHHKGSYICNNRLYIINFKCSIYFPPYITLMLNGSTSSIPFKYENFNTRLGCHSETYLYGAPDFFYFPQLLCPPGQKYWIMYPPPLDVYLHPIEKFRCWSCWDICTTTFYLCRYVSNTVIKPLCRYGIKYNFRYHPCVLLGVSIKVTWSLLWSLFYSNILALCNISLGYPSAWPRFTLLIFLYHILLLLLLWMPPVPNLR